MKIYRLGIHDKKLNLLNYIKNDSISPAIKSDLIKEKSKIDKCKASDWEISKKTSNEYEYIYTSSRNEKNICSIQPVSRSYFKLYQMIKDLPHLLQNNIYCACLAEGPGGFIHCLNDLHKKKDFNILNIYGVTLISKDKSIPYWNSMILNNKLNIINRGIDGTGDIYKKENVDHLINQIGKNHCYLVTADGGFDYSKDYNTQEEISYRLFFCEIYTAMNIQKIGGNFIIKLFDMFNYQTIQLIYLLYCNYSYLEFFKPSTSRSSNSEKYLICSDFQGLSPKIKVDLEKHYSDPSKLYIDVPKSFIQNINEYNTQFSGLQITSINNNLKIIQRKKLIKVPTLQQIETAKRWCELYNLPINQDCIYLK